MEETETFADPNVALDKALFNAAFKDEQKNIVTEQKPQEQPPVTEHLVVEQPKVEQPITEASTNEVDYNKWVKENYGVESAEALKQRLESTKDYGDIQQKALDLETKNKELSERHYTKTEFGKVADELHAKGVKPETIARFNGLDVSKMEPLDVLKLKMEVNNPSLSSTEIQAYLEEKYGTSDELLTDGQKAARKVELAENSNIARGELESFIYKAFNPQEQVDPKALQREQGRQAFWKSQNFQEIKVEQPAKIKVQGAKGVEEIQYDFAYKPSAELSTKFNDSLNTALLTPDYASLYTPDTTGMENANAYRENLYWAIHGPEIVKQYGQHMANMQSKIHESYANSLNNPNARAVNTTAQANLSDNEQANKGAASFLAKNQ